MDGARSSPWPASNLSAMSDEDCLDVPSPSAAAGDENPLLGLLHRVTHTLPLSPSYLWAAASIQSNPSRKRTENLQPPLAFLTVDRPTDQAKRSERATSFRRRLAGTWAARERAPHVSLWYSAPSTCYICSVQSSIIVVFFLSAQSS